MNACSVTSPDSRPRKDLQPRSLVTWNCHPPLFLSSSSLSLSFSFTTALFGSFVIYISLTVVSERMAGSWHALIFIMSLFSDAKDGRLQCHNTGWSGADLIPPQRSPVKRHSLLKSISIPSLSSIVKNSLSRAEDGFNTYRDGLSKEERKARTEREDRRQILYLRMRNVSYSSVR